MKRSLCVFSNWQKGQKQKEETVNSRGTDTIGGNKMMNLEAGKMQSSIKMRSQHIGRLGS